MAKNGTKEDVIELWGREFNTAKKGLDEAQVVSFVNNLIAERDMLAQRQEHFSSLTKLAEKTVAEADNLAKEIRKETKDQAKAEASEIIVKAKEQAQQAIEEDRAKIITIATEEATALQANAEQEAELLLENQRKRIKSELRDVAQRLYGQLLSQLESLRQQAAASEVEFELKLSQPVEEASTITIEKEPLSTPAPAASQQGDDITSSTSPEVSPEPADKQDTTTYKEEVELEILPPIDIMKIMGIMRYLDTLPEVETTELIPIVDKPLIIASLREPMPLIDILRTLPEVDQVKETTATTDNTNANGERRKIQITLSGNTVLDETKEMLNSEVSNALSSQSHSNPG